MGHTAPRAALWALLLVLLASSLAGLPGARASSTPTYTLQVWVQQPGTLAPVPAGVTVDLISQATNATYTAKTLAPGGVPSGEAIFSSANTGGAIGVGWWGVTVPPQAHVTVSGTPCNPCAILPVDPKPVFGYYNSTDLTTTTYPTVLPNVTVIDYTTHLFGNATNGASPAVNASVQLLDPQFSSLVLNNATTNSTGSFNFTAPDGTWVLRTTIRSSPAQFDYQQVTVAGARMTVNPAISAYLVYGHVYQAPSSRAYVPNGGNATVVDMANQNVYTYPVPPGGFYSIGGYPGGFTGPGAANFTVVLSLVGYGTVSYPLSLSPTNTTGGNPRHDVSAPAISAPGTYLTTLNFSTGFNNASVSTVASLTHNAIFPSLPNASIGDLWSQLSLDLSHNLTFSSGDLAAVYAWVQSQGPFFPLVQAGTTVSGVGFGVNNSFTFAPSSTCAGGCGLSSSATMGFTWGAHYTSASTIGAGSKNYTLSFAFKHPTNAESFNYTVKLPAGYVLAAGATAPNGATLVPSVTGGTWTNFTLVSKPYSTASSIATLPIVKYGNVSAIVNITSANFAYSHHNVLNSTRGNYTVVAASGENLTFSAVNSTFPAGTNGTLYNWNFGDGSPNNISAQPSTYHTYAAAKEYNGSLVVTSSGGGTSTTNFVVYAGASAPTATISVNTTVLTAGSVSYAIVNSSTTLHFNASKSVSSLFGGSKVAGILAVANWSLVAHSFSKGANYTAAGAVTDPAGQNFTYTFVGAGYYLTSAVLGSQTISFLGWQYNVSLELWDGGGRLAKATMVVLVRDHQKPAPVVTLYNSGGHSISSSGVVESTNHTAEVQLSAQNSTDPNNGSIAWYNWTVKDASNSSIDLKLQQPAVQPGYKLPFRPIYWLAPQVDAYSVNLTVTDRAGNTAYVNVTVSVVVNASTRPVLAVTDLTVPSTMTDQSTYTAWVNVTNTLGKNSTAEGVSVSFYLLAPSGSGPKYFLSSPSQVQWYNYTDNVSNAVSFATGLISIPYNQTYRAVISFSPARVGTFNLYANATASNEFVSDYSSGANVAHLAVTLNQNPIILDEEIAVVVIAIAVLIFVVVMWRTGRFSRMRGGGGSKSGGSGGSSKSGLERGKRDADDEDDDEKDSKK